MASNNTKLIVALSPDLPEYLHHSIILINTHTDNDGAIGFILNKPIPFKVAEKIVAEIGVGSENKLYSGGPVKPHIGCVIHTDDYRNKHTFKLTDQMFVTTGTQILDDIAASMEPSNYMMILGHCQWEPNQLEHEVNAGYWAVTSVTATDFYMGRNGEKGWLNAIERIAAERNSFLFDMFEEQQT